jgi:hypothetical protein
MIRNAFLFILSIMSTNMGSAKEFNIIDYGAVEKENSTQAIQKAVDQCHTDGGGVVIIPAGKFITGTITLKSYVNLHLQQGAELIGSHNLEDYTTSFRKHGMILCEDANQVSITGEGIINARGTTFYDPTKNHVYEEFDRMLTRQKENYMPEGQFYSDGPIKRRPKPGMTITFYHCSQVSLKDFTLKDTPSWAIRLAYCDDVNVDGLTIANNLMVPNSDGIHCTASRNVRISNCDIRAGDDAIIITGFSLDEENPNVSTTEQEAHTYGNKSIYAENFTVTNCHLQSRSSGIRVGYGQHPIRRCIFSNIQIYGSNRGIGVFAHDVSDIEELIFSDIIIETRLHNGQWWGNGEPIHISAVCRFEGHSAGKVKNVQFNNIIATGEHGLIFYGMEDSQLENIKLNNVRLRIKNGAETLTYGGNFDLRPTAAIEKQLFEHDIPGLYAQYVKGLVIEDFSLDWDDNLPSFFTNAIECVNVIDLDINRINADKNPSCDTCDKIKLKKTTIKKY